MKRYEWQPATSDIPQQPGVYLFLGPKNRVLYVGKAKNLRSRLTSYFQAPEKLHDRTRRMVSGAESLDWTVVPTERQALQLEYLWIKEFSPEFNVRFRDDKSYPYLALTLADDIPRVFLTRRKGIKGARYFGPFPTAGALRERPSPLCSRHSRCDPAPPRPMTGPTEPTGPAFWGILESVRLPVWVA